MGQNKQTGGETVKPITKKAKKAARKLFAKPKHSTRAFSSADYAALPKGEPNATV
jgi:hypothetical protein